MRSRIRELVFLLLLAATGCVSKSRSDAQTRAAFQAGQMQAEVMRSTPHTVQVKGEVKNPIIAWFEGQTVSQALLTAEYQGRWDPRMIIIWRSGQGWQINPNQLVRGGEDPELEPGDVIEIQR